MVRLGQRWMNWCPWYANLQMPFYRNAEGDVLVRFYLNEKPVTLNLLTPANTENGVPAYRWTDVKRQFQHYIDKQRWIDRTRAVNTMVGTDHAVTSSVGRYGKGSEEHGQTLPAVLVPHGMNFWTPQTQDSEQKCRAPYYYRDSLFQGFRASHWLVGGLHTGLWLIHAHADDRAVETQAGRARHPFQS